MSDTEEYQLVVKYLLEPKTNRRPIMDRPRPTSEGGIEKRYVAKGDPQKAYYFEYYDGVKYARIVPKNAGDKEYVRVQEAANGTEWFGVIELAPPAEVAIAQAIRDAGHEIAEAIAGKK